MRNWVVMIGEGGPCRRRWLVLLALSATLLSAVVPASPVPDRVKPAAGAVPATGISVTEPVQVCSDLAEWPPYSYRSPSEPEAVVGVSVDLLERILSREALRWRVELLPWKRCLHLVERGAYQVVTDASLNQDREQTFLVSAPAYYLQQAFFYDRRRHPDGPPALSIESLTRMRLGGLAGYNYALELVDPSVLFPNTGQVDPDQVQGDAVAALEQLRIDTSVDSYADLLEQLRRGRLDLAIGIPEILDALARRGQLSLEEIGTLPIPGLPPLAYHFLFPRNAEGEALKALIDQGLRELQRSGRYGAILEQHGVSATRLTYQAGILAGP